jgi:hypothetical protein
MVWVFVKPRPIYLQEIPGTHCIGSWGGPIVGMDGCGKSRPYRHSIAGPSSPQGVAIPNEITRPTMYLFVMEIMCVF